MAKKPKVNVNSWMSNFIKSTGRYAIDQGLEYAPSIIGTVANTVEAVNDFSEIFPKESMDEFKNQAKENAGYIKKFFDNMKRDLKSGNFYDISKIDTGSDEDFSIDGDWDMDFGDNEEFSEEDFNIEINPTINITSNINGNNPMVKAIQNQTVAGAKQAKASAKQTIEIAEAQMSLMSKLNESVVGQLTGIKSTLDAILEFHNANTKNYYEKTLEMQALQMEHFKALSEAKGFRKRELDTDAVDLLGGAFDVKAYINVVKKNFKRFSNDSMMLTALNEFWTSKDAKESMVANPLSFVVSSLFNAVVPATFVSALKETDELFSKFMPSLFAKMNTLRNNPIFEPIAKIFGLDNKYKTNIDLGNYNKGAVAFDGKVHKAITEVIPTQLAQILAVLKRNPYDPQLYDYDTGTFTSSKKALKEHKDRLKNTALGEYDVDEIRKRLSTVSYRDSDEKKEVDKALEAVLMRMTSTGELIDFRKKKNKRGEEIDQFAAVIRDAGIYLSPAKLNLLRHAILKSPRLAQMGITASIFNSRQAVSNYTQNIENGEAGGVIRQALAIAEAENIDKAYKEYLKKSKTPKSTTKVLDAKGEEARKKKLLEQYRLEYSDDLTEKEIIEMMEKRAKFVDGKMESRIKNADPEKRSIFTELKGLFRSTIHLPFNISTKILDKMSNTMYEIIFGKEFDEKDAEKGFLERWNDYLVQSLDKIKEFFKEQFGDPVKRIYGKAKDYITGSQTYKDIKNFLFGEKDSDGKITTKGLFSNTLGEFKNLGSGLRRLFTGKGYVDNVTGEQVGDLSEKESVFGIFKNTFFQIGDFIKTTLVGGWDFAKDSYGKLKGPDGKPFSLVDSIKSGFNDFLTLFFGDKEMYGRKNTHYMTLDTFKDAMKKNAPKALALGMGFGLANLTGISSSLGILGSIFMPGGPIGAALVGTGIGFLTQAEFFKEFMFGKMVNGKRTDTGIISTATQEAFEKHKGAIIGGAAVGGIMALLRKNIFASLASSFLGPAFIAKYGIAFSLMGGPIGGAAIGAGLAYLKSSESAREWLFGKGEWLKTSGSRLAERFITAFNAGGFRAIGRGIVGAGLGALSVGGLALAGFNPIGAIAGLTAKALAFGGISMNMGFLGSLSTKLLAGAIAGGAFGITASFSKWQTYMFGEVITRSGVQYKIPGVLGRLGNMLKWEVFEPIKVHLVNGLESFRLWFRKDIMANVQDIFVPLVHQVSYYAKKFVSGIGKVFAWLNPKNFIIEAFIAPIGKYLVAPLVGFFKSSSTALFKTMGEIIAKPFKVMGYMANKLILAQFGHGLKGFRQMMVNKMKDAYLNSNFHKELVRPVIRIFTYFGNEILFQVKGFFSKASKILLAAIKLPFKIIGFTAKMGLKAAALPFTLPFKAINAYRKNRIRAIGSFKATGAQQAAYDSFKEDNGFFSALGGLLSTFVPGSSIRRLAQTDDDFGGASYVPGWQRDKDARDKDNSLLASETADSISGRNRTLREEQKRMRKYGYGPMTRWGDDDFMDDDIAPDVDLSGNVDKSNSLSQLVKATNTSNHQLRLALGKDEANKLYKVRNNQMEELKRKYGSAFSGMDEVSKDNVMRDVINSENTNIIAQNSIKQTSLLTTISELIGGKITSKGGGKGKGKKSSKGSSSDNGANTQGRDVGSNNERVGNDVPYKESDSVHDEDYESQKAREKGTGWLARTVDKLYDWHDEMEIQKSNPDGGGIFGLLGRLKDSLSGIGLLAGALLLPGPRNLLFQGLEWLGTNILPKVMDLAGVFFDKYGDTIKKYIGEGLKIAAAWLFGLDYKPETDEQREAREKSGNGLDITDLGGEFSKRMNPEAKGTVSHTNFILRTLRQPSMAKKVLGASTLPLKAAKGVSKLALKGIGKAHAALKATSFGYRFGSGIVKWTGKGVKKVGSMAFDKFGKPIANKLYKSADKALTKVESKLFSELVENGHEKMAMKIYTNIDDGVSLLPRVADDFVAFGKNIFGNIWNAVKKDFAGMLNTKIVKSIDDILLTFFKKDKILAVLKKASGVSKSISKLYAQASANASVVVPVIGVIINTCMYIYGAVKGNNMAAWLFQVQPEDVTPLQRLLSMAVFAGLEGNALGGFLDLLDTIVRACWDMFRDGLRNIGIEIPINKEGTGFIQFIAQFIYSALLKLGDTLASKLGIDVENEKMFRESQSKMYDRYLKNVNKDSGISYDEYMTSHVGKDPDFVLKKTKDFYSKSWVGRAWDNIWSFGKAGMPDGLDPTIYDKDQIKKFEAELKKIEGLPEAYTNNDYNLARKNASMYDKKSSKLLKEYAEKELKVQRKLLEKALKEKYAHAEKEDASDEWAIKDEEISDKISKLKKIISGLESDLNNANNYLKFDVDKFMKNAPSYSSAGSGNHNSGSSYGTSYGAGRGGTSDETYMDSLAGLYESTSKILGLKSPTEMMNSPLAASNQYTTLDGRSSKALEFMKAKYIMTSPFGENRGSSIHEGIDLVSSVNDPVPAFMPGKVHKVYNKARPNTGNMNSSEGGGFGNHVIIKDRNNMYHTYAHLNSVANNITPGTEVNMFDVLGTLGHTGRSTGAHLHYQIADDTVPGKRKPVNPFDYILTGARNGGYMSRDALKNLKVDAIAHALSNSPYGAPDAGGGLSGSTANLGFFDELMSSINMDLGALIGIPTGPGGSEGNTTFSKKSELSPLTFNYSGKGIYDAQAVVDYDKNPDPSNLNGGEFLDVFSKAPLEKRSDGNSLYYRNSDWFDRNLKSGVGNITEDYMNRWIEKATRSRPDSPFRGQGAAFIKAAQATGLDPRYIMAHAALESGWGTSGQTKDGNYFGIGVYDGKKGNSFGTSSFETSIVEGSKWIAENYVDRGQNTIWKMHTGHEYHNFNRGNWWANNLTKILDNAPKGGSSSELTMAQLMSSFAKSGGRDSGAPIGPSGIKLPRLIDGRLVEIIEILKAISSNTNETTDAIRQLLMIVANEAKVKVTKAKSKPVQSRSVNDNNRLRQYDNALDIAMVR